MSHHAPLLIELPSEARLALNLQARASGTSSATLARHLLTNALTRRNRMTLRAPATNRSDLLGPIRDRLGPDFAAALAWDDLEARVAVHGYTIRARGSDLALYCKKTAVRLCKLSDLGWPAQRLAARFGSPFPAHDHGRLSFCKQRVPVDPEDTGQDVVLIEDE